MTPRRQEEDKNSKNHQISDEPLPAFPVLSPSLDSRRPETGKQAPRQEEPSSSGLKGGRGDSQHIKNPPFLSVFSLLLHPSPDSPVRVVAMAMTVAAVRPAGPPKLRTGRPPKT